MRMRAVLPVVLSACAGEPDPPPAAGGSRIEVDPPVPEDLDVPDAPGRPSIVRDLPFEVCINEFMPSNRVSLPDVGAADGPDWVELHNPTDTDVALDGWSMTDDPTRPDKHLLTGGLVLEARGYLVLWADGAPDRGPTHLGFALSRDGEAVGLFAPDGTGSVVRYGAVPADLAVARISDCCVDSGCFGFVFAGTPGASNGG